MADQTYRSLRDRLAGSTGTIMIIGAPDTGKTTLAKLIAEDALTAGSSVAYVDGDVAASTVGPPACTGMRLIRSTGDLEPGQHADELRFVGSTSPQGVVLPHVVCVASLVELAREQAEVVVVDTTSIVAGVVGQTLKYHLWELLRPDLVVAIERGEELEPIIGMLRRFLSARIAVTEPPPGVVAVPPTERHASRMAAFAEALAPPLQRWRVQTTVFAPTLPEGFDLSRLHGMLVGVQDDRGHCLGLGGLEHAEGVVRVATQHGDDMRGLRLGSMRIDLETYATQQVRLRQLIFGI